MSHPNFWNDQEKARSVIEKMRSLKSQVDEVQQLEKELEDLSLLYQLAEEARDAETAGEVDKDARKMVQKLERMEFQSLLGGEEEKRGAILSIHAGAGGTEACDWVQMLLRMYLRWAERSGFKTRIVDSLPGEEAGIKNVTVLVDGEYVYGYLQSEIGVHRLVRISPFDANRRRHTSFCSVDVIPQVDENIKIDIKESDLKIETFRSSGHGGQHVNVTDSAVRITHIPTKIVVQCQNERSQHQNRQQAMKVLMARLYEYHRQKQVEKEALREAQKKDIAWGSQIRSYIFHPYTMVKDHRTGVEVADVTRVMDGDIDIFLNEYLKQKAKSS